MHASRRDRSCAVAHQVLNARHRRSLRCARRPSPHSITYGHSAAALGLSCGLKGNGMCFGARTLDRHGWAASVRRGRGASSRLVRNGVRTTSLPRRSCAPTCRSHWKPRRARISVGRPAVWRPSGRSSFRSSASASHAALRCCSTPRRSSSSTAVGRGERRRRVRARWRPHRQRRVALLAAFGSSGRSCTSSPASPPSTRRPPCIAPSLYASTSRGSCRSMRARRRRLRARRGLHRRFNGEMPGDDFYHSSVAGITGVLAILQAGAR